MLSADRVDVVTMTTAPRSRVTCRQLLESVTCYDVMPRKTCVVVIDAELPVCAHSCSCSFPLSVMMPKCHWWHMEAMMNIYYADNHKHVERVKVTSLGLFTLVLVLDFSIFMPTK